MGNYVIEVIHLNLRILVAYTKNNVFICQKWTLIEEKVCVFNVCLKNTI